MRHFLVFTLASLLIAASAVGIRADNQTVADSIATGLSEQFPNEDVTVQVQDGKVWLSGQIASASEMFKMIQFVSEMEGVKLVENQMTLIKATETPATGNPRAEKTAIVQIAMNKPVPMAPQPQVVSAQPTRQTSRIPARKAPTPMVITTADIDGLELEETIVQTGSNQAIHAYQSLPMMEEYEVTANYHTQMPLGVEVQPVAHVAHRAPRDFAGQNGSRQAAVAVSGPQYAGGCSPNLPDYAWPSYAAHPNYSQVTYPKYYKANAWPHIGPFYPYPQPPLGWRKTTLEWHDGKWWLDFDDGSAKGPFSPIFRAR